MSQLKAYDDPRDPAQESKFTLPNTWYRDESDGLSSSGMFLAGLIMVTRNRYLAWPATLFAVNGLINQHPLRSKEGRAIGGWNNILLCLSALVASYFPLFFIPKPVSSTT
ncbi:hypothetical protein AMATHDRAFT_137362 [Amanita thiersii Skay4041]|uniref:Uncharacterized protein n=1 Tax=Amanita thiersii Skay4041 TaxID=703135 RepID=A0A2A9NZE5_9AGAR|nr:hypothetical protein AMATHDRAFT_137362 [Amanita thiersii Skay4041]